MKKFLLALNEKLEGFRGILAIWIPMGVAYMDTMFMGLTAFSKEGMIVAAQLAVVPTVKLIYTDAIPKMQALYVKWLNT